MKLLETIINELSDSSISLTSPLIKTKILANRINNIVLSNWVTKELQGYDDNKSVPEYRRCQGDFVGTYINGRHQITNAPLSLVNLDPNFDKKIRIIFITQGVATLEKFVDSKSRRLEFENNSTYTNIIEDLMRDVGENVAPNFKLISSSLITSSSVVNDVLNIVRIKLLEFMINLEQEFGIELNIERLSKEQQKITYIMETTINAKGDGNNIISGNNNAITSNNNFKKGDKHNLANELKNQGLSDEDISELLAVIDSESPNSAEQFGDNVNKWILKMLGKAMDTSWKIGISAAGGVLGKVIAQYYGLS